MLETQP